MPQGKCAFCGTFVTAGGTPLGKHSVACPNCKRLAERWLERHGEAAVAVAEGEPERASGADGQPAEPEPEPSGDEKPEESG